MRIRQLVIATALAGMGLVSASGAQQSASELAQALQRKYDGVRDFSADFVQVYKGGVLRKELTERGRMQIRKPGRMRWEYAAPERKLFVSDGLKMYYYVPADKQVTVTAVPSDDVATGPALFLSGKGNLTRDFRTSITEAPAGFPAGTKGLKLEPIKAQPDYDWLVLLVDGSTLALRGLQATDAQGGVSSFTFTNLKENIGLADKDFAFSMPRGVDVVTDSGRR
jgi:outer membrane lipoprotein carrier protein